MNLSMIVDFQFQTTRSPQLRAIFTPSHTLYKQDQFLVFRRMNRDLEKMTG